MVEHWHRVQRIYIGDQVAAHPISIDQLYHPGFFDRLFASMIAWCEKRIPVETPSEWGIRNAHIGKNFVIELALPYEQLV